MAKTQTNTQKTKAPATQNEFQWVDDDGKEWISVPAGSLLARETGDGALEITGITIPALRGLRLLCNAKTTDDADAIAAIRSHRDVVDASAWLKS